MTGRADETGLYHRHTMTTGERATGGRASGRERLLETAYRLFSRHGTRAVGIDRIIAESGVAKMTLYRNFASKDDLILAFLELREQRWTRAWLQDTVMERAATPAQRLLTIFDVFGEWFALDDFEGCSFINVMLELDDVGSPVRRESVRQLSEIRAFIAALAQEAGVQDADAFARQWHILMKGCIVAAAEGDRQAGARARELGTLLLSHHGIAPH
jgi:AcrR family transcriptional regulator